MGNKQYDEQLREIFFKQEFDAQKWNASLDEFIRGIVNVIEEESQLDLMAQAPELMQSEAIKEEKYALKQFIVGELARIERAVEIFFTLQMRSVEYQNGILYDLALKSVAANEIILNNVEKNGNSESNPKVQAVAIADKA